MRSPTRPGYGLAVPKLLAAAVAVLLAGVLAGCGPIGESALPDLSGEERIEAVATIGMVGDAVARVGGERVRVQTLMGAGVDPHVYKASEGDLRRLEAADIIFFEGLHLEAKMADVLEKIGERRRTVAVGEAVPKAELIADPELGEHPDPHIWFDARIWKHAVGAVRDALVEADPAHAAAYRANAAVYLRELDELHAYAMRRAAALPAERRVIITAHDAFSYFGRAYGFEVMGLQGISTASEAGAKDVQQLAELIARRKIPAVFVESSVSPRTIEAVQQAVRARGFDVRIGGSLYADAMGTEGTPEGTYLGMFRANVETIVNALGGGGR